MKKIIVSALIGMLLPLALVGSGFAQANTVVVKGQIIAMDGVTLTLESAKDGTVIITLPTIFDTSMIKIGDTVMVKANRQANGSLVATSIRVLVSKGLGAGQGSGQGGGQGGGKPENAGRANSAYCSPDKNHLAHPLAEKFAVKYAVGVDWVMGYYCGGQSMGAIMLALKTAQLTGADPDDLLAQRVGGNSWGLIWQNLGLIGSEKDVKSPPGQLKKQTSTGLED